MKKTKHKKQTTVQKPLIEETLNLVFDVTIIAASILVAAFVGGKEAIKEIRKKRHNYETIHRTKK